MLFSLSRKSPTLFADFVAYSIDTHTANQLARLTLDNTSRDKYYCPPSGMACLIIWRHYVTDSHEAKYSPNKHPKYSRNKPVPITTFGLTSSISIMSSSDSQQACWSWSARSSSCSSKSNISAILTIFIFVSGNGLWAFKSFTHWHRSTNGHRYRVGISRIQPN